MDIYFISELIINFISSFIVAYPVCITFILIGKLALNTPSPKLRVWIFLPMLVSFFSAIPASITHNIQVLIQSIVILGLALPLVFYILTYKKSLPLNTRVPVRYKGNKLNPFLKRTYEQKELINNFISENSDFLTAQDSKLYELINRAESQLGLSGASQLQSCYDALNHYNSYKNFCYSKGAVGKMYFDDKWEHCESGEEKNFRYIKPIEEKIKSLQGY